MHHVIENPCVAPTSSSPHRCVAPSSERLSSKRFFFQIASVFKAPPLSCCAGLRLQIASITQSSTLHHAYDELFPLHRTVKYTVVLRCLQRACFQSASVFKSPPSSKCLHRRVAPASVFKAHPSRNHRPSIAPTVRFYPSIAPLNIKMVSLSFIDHGQLFPLTLLVPIICLLPSSPVVIIFPAQT